MGRGAGESFVTLYKDGLGENVFQNRSDFAFVLMMCHVMAASLLDCRFSFSSRRPALSFIFISSAVRCSPRPQGLSPV